MRHVLLITMLAVIPGAAIGGGYGWGQVIQGAEQGARDAEARDEYQRRMDRWDRQRELERRRLEQQRYRDEQLRLQRERNRILREQGRRW